MARQHLNALVLTMLSGVHRRVGTCKGIAMACAGLVYRRLLEGTYEDLECTLPGRRGECQKIREDARR